MEPRRRSVWAPPILYRSVRPVNCASVEWGLVRAGMRERWLSARHRVALRGTDRAASGVEELI